MAQVRKIAGLAVISVVGLTAALWTGAGLWAMSLGPAWFAGQLKERTGIEAAIGSLRTNFLTTVSFREVILSSPVRGKIDEVRVSFRPWDLLSLRFRNRHLFLLTFVRPDLQVPDRRLSNGSLKSHGPLKVIPFGARVEDGRVAFAHGDKVWQIENLNGSLGATPFHIEAETDAEIGGIGSVHARLRSACLPPRNWEVRFAADSLDVGAASELLADSAPSLGSLTGRTGAELEMKGTWGKNLTLGDWQLRLKPTGVTWQRTPTLRPMALTGTIDASPRLLKFSPLKVGKATTVEGDVRSPWQKPEMDLKVKASKENVAQLFGYVLAGAPPVEGELSAAAEIRGAPQSPQIKTTYDFSGAVGRLQLPPATGELAFASGAVESTTSFAGGKFLVSGVGVGGPTPVWSIVAKGLSVAAVGETNGWKNVEGTLGARFLVRSSPGILTGHVDADSLRWGRLAYSGVHSASVRFTRNEFIVRADDGSVSMTASREGSRLDIEALTLAFGKAGNVSADGNVDLDSRRVDLNAEISGLSPDAWPPLVQRYPDLTGDVSAKGKLTGSLDSPTARFDLTWGGVRFDPDEDPYEGRGQLVVDPATVALDQTTLARGYTGRAVFHRDTGQWEAALHVDQADPSLIWDVANSTEDVSGDISGELKIRGGNAIVATSSFTWSTGQIGNFSFDEASAGFEWNGDRISIHGASLVKGSEAIRGQADLQKAKGGWTFTSDAQVQRWGAPPLTVDGEIEAEGKIDTTARRLEAALTSPVLWVADRSVEDLKARLHGDEKRWTVSGTSDDKALFNLTLDRETGALGGKLAAHDLRLGDIFPQTQKADASNGAVSPPSGIYDIEADLAGTLTDPAARIRASLRDAEWREEPFSAEAVVDVNRSTVTIATAKVALKAGGEVLAHGAIGVGKNAPITIEGAGSEVDLQAIFHWLAWPVHWNGHADTSFSIVRDGGPLSARIKFEGEHDGFGPFRDGGVLRGEISGHDREWDLSGVFVESGDGHVQLREGSKLYLDKGGAATLRVVGDVRNLRLGPLTLFGGAEVVGHWKEEAEGETRKIGLDLFARSLYINQFVLDGNVTRISIQDQKIVFSPIPGSGQQLSGTLSYDHYPDLLMKDFRFLEGGKERIALTGNVGAERWDFTARARGIDAAIVRGLLDTSLTMSGPMDLDVVGKGAPTDPDITADVKWTNGRVGVLPLDQAEGKFTYKDGEVLLDDVSVQRKHGYQMSGSAHVGIGDDRDVPMEINVRVDKGDLALLTSMFPEVSLARGSFEGRLRIGGSAGLATISGYLNAQKILLRSVYTPRLDKGELRLRFDKNRLLVDKAVARLGHGDVVGGGYVDFKNGFPDRYDLSLKSVSNHGAEIHVPELAIAAGTVLSHFRLFKNELAGISRGEPLVDLEFSGPADSPTLAGTVTLDNTVFTYPPASSSGGENPWFRSFIDRVNWDVTLTAGRRTWYQNELVDAAVSGNVDIRGPHDDLAVNGKVHSEQGSIVYSGNEFVIKEADVEIDTRKPVLASDQKQTVVYLKATAERDVFYTDALGNNNHDVIVMVVDRAPIGEIQPRFYSKSNPNLSSQRALQLALGLPFADSIETNSLLPDQRTKVSDSADSDKLLRLGLIQLLDSNLASPLARAIARKTGLVDYIRVTYQENDPHAQEGVVDVPDKTGTTDVNQNQFLKYAKGTQVRVGRELGGRLFADYSFRVDQYESSINLRHELELAYRVHNNLFLRGTSELANERALGRPPDRRAILENQWRFGLPRRKQAAPPAVPAAAVEEKPKAG